jgi:hypothetical protein
LGDGFFQTAVNGVAEPGLHDLQPEHGASAWWSMRDDDLGTPFVATTPTSTPPSRSAVCHPAPDR